MITIIGSAITTLLTAFVETKTQFMMLQAGVRIFSYAEDMLCIVVIAEEFEARARGWAIGALGALMAIGVGLASLVFALVNFLPFGWRALYVVGAIPLFLIAWYRRGLRETQRFQQLDSVHKQEEPSRFAIFRPAVLLFKEYPLRVLMMAATVAPVGFALGPQPIFMSKWLQETHGFTPGGITLLFLTGGLISIMGSFVAGKVSDLIGRRVVFMASSVGCAIGFGIFYSADALVIVLPAWVAATFFLLAVDALVYAFGAELFPTSHRATASALRVATSLFAGAAGLALEGSLYTWLGSHSAALTALLGAVPIGVAIALLLPDAARRELEEVSPEKIEVRH
jgi:putative MFS transporter